MIRKKQHIFYIHWIQESSNSWISDLASIATSAVDFFQGLLSGQDSHFQVSDFDFIPSLVMEDDDLNLYRESSLEEVR